MAAATDDAGSSAADVQHEDPVEDQSVETVAGEPWWRRPPVITAAALGVLGLLYGLDLLVTAGDVPRGTSVAGMSIGGLSQADAEQKLRDTLAPRLTTQLDVAAADQKGSLTAASAGIDVDWTATVVQAGSQPLSPWTRLVSLFSDTDRDAVVRLDVNAFDKSLAGLRAKVDREVVEGDIRYDATTPVGIEPKAGQKIDAAGAANALLAASLRGGPARLPVVTVTPQATPDGVRAALDGFARQAVSGPATVNGDGRSVTIDPRSIATALTFQPDGTGGLRPSLTKAKLQSLADQLASTEKPGQDARVTFDADKPTVVPGTEGRVIDWDKTLSTLVQALGRADNRTVDAGYTTASAKVTAQDINGLGIKEIIGEFTTKGFAQDSGVNIRVVAAKVNGAVVKPGETFSLNGYTGPRGTAQGYVQAGVIEDGVPAREVGGGISQFATTLFNAGYFGGMTDAGHKEHSFYISRYPGAREATVFQNPDGSSVIDLKFTNESPTGVAIQTIWTPTSITVRLWGTKHVNVESIPGNRHDYVSPPTVTKPPGGPCKASRGQQGFTTSDTRVIRDLSGKELSRTTHTVRYNPQPTVVCSP
ncbi:VanW family protein [Kibdelosporangium philippinense]|uniref:VanW family protein n=1 Tax=Kibdelosporangium philippinense TaxID=211113 RepID=A0ABS8ZD32_9PSEU|nr:VanW family protein [Kibdelosporangium philippinense]MCE7004586.1 VanW family protein [Kibdelosporangium philippinense]